MSGLILTEKKPGVQLYVALSGIRISSMEELCYYLCHNIYAIDGSFFDEAFFDFLRGMEEEKLIQKLNMDILSGKHYSDLAGDVIGAVDYYSDAEKAKISEEFLKIKTRTPAENRKARADILRERGRYAEAMEEYSSVLEEGVGASDESIADVWNNIGVMRAGAFRYLDAVKCFEKALDRMNKQEYLDNLVCALIMAEEKQSDLCGKKQEQLKKEMLFKYQIDAALFDRYQAVIRQEEQKIAAAPETLAFQNKVSFQGRSDINRYYEEVDRVMAQWKAEYREQEKERQLE